MTMSKKCPQKAIIFARVSSVNQAEGRSLNSQVSHLQAYCKEKDLEAIKEFQLIENSTTKDKRRFLEMINFIKKQEGSIALIVDSVDRLQRSFKEVPIFEGLRMSGKLALHFVKENQVLDKKSNSAQLMAYQLFNLMATNYARAISDNAKRSVQAKLERGEYMGRAPFGYRHILLLTGKKKITICPVNSVVVIEIFNLYSEEFNSINSLAKKFELSLPVVSKMLSNPFYYGDMCIKSHSKLYHHKYERLISKRLFDECQKVRKLRKNA